MKKRIFAFTMAIAVAISMMTGCSQQPDNNNDGQNVSDNVDNEENNSNKLDYEKIVVGLDDTFAPMGFRDENGDLAGVDIDLADAVSEVLEIPFELQPIDWTMKESELNNKNIDLIWNGYSITDIRKEQVAFSEAYLKNKQIVLVMANSDINTLEDLSGKTVAVQDQSSAVAAIEKKPQIRDTFGNMVTFETNDQCLRDLEAGRSDAVVADEVLIRYYILQKGEENYKILEEDFGDEEYAIGIRKGDTELLEAINSALKEISENGKSKEISEKWFGSDIILK